MEYDGRMYEADLLNLLSAMFPTLRPIRDLSDDVYIDLFKVHHACGIDKKSIGPAGWQFCSELVANIYQAYNVISSAFDPKNILPVDFFGYDGLP